MSSLISGLTAGLNNTPFLNNATQRVLSQSNNVSYSARGIYRVQDTEPSRKADYWFRDFGMVMACCYMMEFGFRGVDALYTVPIITDALKLDQLSKLTDANGVKRYPKALNYGTLPEIFRQRVMGSLIRSASSDLVPKLMQELELHHAGKLDDPNLRGKVEAILKSPNIAGTDALMEGHLRDFGLKEPAIQGLSAIENKTRRSDKMKAFLKANPTVDAKSLEKAVMLEDARQMRILIDHLHIHMNFAEYVKENVLSVKDSKVSEIFVNLLKEFSDKGMNLYDEAEGKEKLAKTLKEIWYLPPKDRETQFNKKIAEFKKQLHIRNGVPLVTDRELKQFINLSNDYRQVLKDDDKEALPKVINKFKAFYSDLPNHKNDHVQKLYEQFDQTLIYKIKGKIKAAVKEALKTEAGPARTEKLAEKIKALKLETHFDPGAIDQLIKGITEDIKQPAITDADIFRENMRLFNPRFSAFEQALSHHANGLLGKVLKPDFVGEKTTAHIKHLLSEGINTQTALNLISKAQKSSTWPKAFSTVLLNMVFYGFLASNFDNKILQPYQQKLVAERGTSQDIVNAGYLALIPGGLVLTQLFDRSTLPLIRKLGSFNRFALVGGAALSTFAGSTYLILQQLLKLPPKHPPVPPAQARTDASTQHPAATPIDATKPAMGGNFSPFTLPGQPVGFNRNGFGAFNGIQAAQPNFSPSLGAPQFGAQAKKFASPWLKQG